MTRPSAGRIGYFGKIPTRSDFIKAADDVPLMGVLDQWLAKVMSELARDARWKINYDAMAPLHFAFVGPHSHHAIGGHIVASHDESGRRFPFLLMRTCEVEQPAQFLATSPLALAPLWRALAATAQQAMLPQDPAAALQAIAGNTVELDESCRAAQAEFAGSETLGSLARLLGGVDVKRVMLALGMLLQPVMRSGRNELEHSLLLPLPALGGKGFHVAAYWLELIAPFLQYADFELALFLVRVDGREALVVGFSGASPDTLQAIIDPIAGAAVQVNLAEAAWVDEQVGIERAVNGLGSYLDQPQLPLALARDLFLKTFTGA